MDEEAVMREVSRWSTLQLEARRLHVSVDYLRRLVRDGELEHLRVGGRKGRIRIRPADAERLLAGRRAKNG
jgi:excisionase family DNA binding protein